MTLDSKQLAAQAQFDKQSSHYGRSHQILSNLEDLEFLAPYLPVARGALALDVATGGGHTALFLARLGYEVTASDISGAMLEVAERLAAEEGFSIRTRQHSAEELPYPAETFSIVSCRVAPHHFTDPARFVRESARVLIPGGFFLVVDSTVPDDSPEAAQWLNRVEKLRDPSHVRLLSPSEWLSLCRKAGLELVFWHVHPLKQPDLEEHFRRANTSAANRKEALRLVEEASQTIRDIYRLSQEKGKISWFWPRLGLVARKSLSHQ